MVRLIWAIIWRGSIASSIAWKVVGGPLTPAAYYPQQDKIQLVLGVVVLLVSFALSAWWVLENKERWN